MTCTKVSQIYAILAYSWIQLPISTGARNCTSSMWLIIGGRLFKNLQVHNQPNQYPIRRINPPNTLPLRFLSQTCMIRVLVRMVDEMGTDFYLVCFSCVMRLWIKTDYSQVGGLTSSDFFPYFFLVYCLWLANSWMILKCSLSPSKFNLGTSLALCVSLFLETMTNLAEQASLSTPPQIFCRTSICTSIELFPTNVTYPDNVQFNSIEIGQKNQIESMAAVTFMNGRVLKSKFLSLSGVQYLQATLAAMQSMSQSNLPTRKLLFANCAIFFCRIGFD